RKRNFAKVHTTRQLPGNSQTCPRPFNEVVELYVGVLSPAALHTGTRQHTGPRYRAIRITVESCQGKVKPGETVDATVP
ncbi:hypothetical protein WH47_02403, partial [Habropoda laboriosa]